jgi:hypothetical protein
MARHLCIVARDNSPLYGYLTIAFRERPPGAATLEIVLDRRHGDSRREGNGAPRGSVAGQDRRRHSAVDEAVRVRGYAIFTGPGGGAPSRQDEAFIQRAIGLLADVERRGPLALRFGARRRAMAVAVARSAAIVLGVVVLLAAVLRLGGIGRIADGAADWADATVRGIEEAWLTLRGQAATPEPRGERAPASSAVAPRPSPATPIAAERSAPADPVPISPAVIVTPAAAPPARPPTEPSRLVDRAPAPPALSLPPRATAVETTRPSPPPAPRETADSADARSLPAFSGLLPRVEISRQASPSGSGVVYAVRLADSSGRPFSGAQIWLRGQTADGQTRETRLEDTERPGVYTSGVLPPDLMPPTLSVRAFFSNMRVEIPIDH